MESQQGDLLSTLNMASAIGKFGQAWCNVDLLQYGFAWLCLAQMKPVRAK